MRRRGKRHARCHLCVAFPSSSSALCDDDDAVACCCLWAQKQSEKRPPADGNLQTTKTTTAKTDKRSCVQWLHLLKKIIQQQHFQFYK